jgi:hypothetical protein
MRAPAPQRSTDEIVAEIMEILEAPAVEALVRKLMTICMQTACCLVAIEEPTRSA